MLCPVLWGHSPQRRRRRGSARLLTSSSGAYFCCCAARGRPARILMMIVNFCRIFCFCITGVRGVCCVLVFGLSLIFDIIIPTCQHAILVGAIVSFAVSFSVCLCILQLLPIMPAIYLRYIIYNATLPQPWLQPQLPARCPTIAAVFRFSVFGFRHHFDSDSPA